MTKDYYTFGSPMPGRQYNSSSYRYSVNGQEKTDEISGAGNHTTALYWEYDTRLGIRWNRDPKGRPEESPYACFGDNPIMNSDVNGDFWITDHIAIDKQAYYLAYGKEMNVIRLFRSIVKTVIIETLKSHENAMHLDNMNNGQMQSFLSSGGYSKMDSHTLQDFYSHSNYVEIMRENGYSDESMVTFDRLDPNSEIFKTVMSKLETTKYPDEGQKNGHDGKAGAKNSAKGYKDLYNNPNKTPLSSDNFLAKDANGMWFKYRLFHHENHDVAKRLAIDATVAKNQGTTTDNAPNDRGHTTRGDGGQQQSSEPRSLPKE